MFLKLIQNMRTNQEMSINSAKGVKVYITIFTWDHEFNIYDDYLCHLTSLFL